MKDIEEEQSDAADGEREGGGVGTLVKETHVRVGRKGTEPGLGSLLTVRGALIIFF